MTRRVLILLNGQSPFFTYWEKFVDWEELELIPVFCSIYPPNSASEYEFITFRKGNKVLRYLRMWWSLPKVVEKYKIELIHTHFFLHHGLIGLSRTQLPQLITLYGSDVYRISAFQRLLITKLLRRRISEATFHAQSRVTLDVIQKKVPLISKKYERYWGIDPLYFKKLDNKTKEEIIYVSPRSIKPLYNIEFLVDVFIESRLERSRLIVLTGTAEKDSPYYRRMKSKIYQNQNIELVEEFLTAESLCQIFDKSHYTIQIPDTDQLALSIVESMARGCKPILSDLQVYRDTLPLDLVEFVSTNDPAELQEVFRKNETMTHSQSQLLHQFGKSFGSMKVNLTKLYSDWLDNLFH